MNIYLFDSNRIITFSLPAKRIGDFWLRDSQNNNMVNISAKEGEWVLSPSKNTKVFDSAGKSENICLKVKNFYIVEKNEEKFLLYCDYSNDTSFKNYLVKDNTVVKVGSGSDCTINIRMSNILPEHVHLNYQGGKWNVEVLENAACYLNDKKLKKGKTKCDNGDLVNIYGVKILLIHGSLFINSPFNNVVVHGLEEIHYIVSDKLSDEEIDDKPYYTDDDYFLKSPRIRKYITTYSMKIDSPPAKENIQDIPLWVTMAPMLTMVASSMMTLSNALMAYLSNEKTFAQIVPTLLISACMIFSMLIWPNISRKMQKKAKIKREEERQAKYSEYINKKDRELLVEYENQKRIIEDNILSTNVCYDMIMNKRRTLWSRRNDQDDFLTVRVGIGDERFDAQISYSTEDFTMENDNLKVMVDRLVNNYRTIRDVPMSYSLAKNTLTGINGIFPKYITFTNNIILQLMAFHSYDDLKFVVFTNEANKDRWEYLANSPYCFSNDKSIRYFATNTDEMQEVSNYLEQIFNGREVLKENNVTKFNNGFFIIIVDDIDVARKIKIVNSVIKSNRNNGFSMLILEEKLSKIPSEVSRFLVIGEKTSIMMDTANNEQRKFIEETNEDYDMHACSKVLSNLPLYSLESAKQLPNNITFLELFGVGKIEQLNVLNRWQENNPVKSLKAEIGANINNEPFILDLHEKAHGPHGLVAGMTGSGKSEFIITYVLSMAVNYSPEEVQFVLIDYKGGGLASAFVNSDTGEKLPHIAGTITNLDKAEINRTLASINSELRRRQAVFNEVKMKTGEGTIDIYKYQRLYRDGVLNEPMSHLVIVCDEFAELKSQQPDFMDDLVSAARIGRSLGVHLILATQKPSGVVDAQIWSNAKFKICLKVQDKQDSTEMIRNDLAAELKQVGRFYLLVGYSEFFAIGQSAWAGAQYFPNNEFKKPVDKNLYLIDNVGSVNRTINNVREKNLMVSQGEELTNIVKYLIDIGNQSTHLKLSSLWLDSIPKNIYVDDLVKKYNYKKEDYVINPIVGEYDDPTNQKQDLLTINLNEVGNTLIYGMNESGKDEILQSLVYSMLSNYSTDELHLYLVDFGAETLINFREAPQVGDVVINGDDEKVNNLSKYLYVELNKRKKLFTKFGGSYQDYIKNSGETLPSIVVIINSVEIMNEVYQDIIEKYIPSIREGAKYGIYFIITSETQSTVKMKVVQSCKNALCLQMANDLVYRDILGRTNGIIPSSTLGRGLCKLDNVCEFQTAFITKDDSLYNTLKKFVEELKAKGMKNAPVIHVMPEIVELKPMMKKYTGLDSVPVGIIKDNLNIMKYNFAKKVTTVITSSEFETMGRFIKNLINVFDNNENKFMTTIIDASRFYETFDHQNISYLNSQYNEFVDSLDKANQSILDILAQNDNDYRSIASIPNNLIVIIGFEKFYNKLDDDHKKMFQKILTSNKEEPKMNFVYFDIPSSFKKYEYEDWYKQSMDTSNAIWIGPGVGQQFLVKITNSLSSFSAIDKDHANVVVNGAATIVKLINEIK